MHGSGLAVAEVIPSPTIRNFDVPVCNIQLHVRDEALTSEQGESKGGVYFMRIELQGSNPGDFSFALFRAMGLQTTSGADLGECAATAVRIQEGDFESWIEEWARIADRVALEAETALRRGHVVTSQQSSLRASTYYQAAEFFTNHEDPRKIRYWQRSRECFQQGQGYLSSSIEPVTIPFEGASLPGYFISGGEGKRPTLLAMGGFDSSGEEVLYGIGLAAAARGWHCLVFEGPGQRGALHLNPGLVFRHDYEVPVRAVVDYALTRPGVDQERLALVGYSLGGYFAPRAAAFDPRIKACIANSLLVNPGQAFGLIRSPAASRWMYAHASWTLGIKQAQDLSPLLEKYTLFGLEEQLKTPLLVVFGEDEIAFASPQVMRDTFHFLAALSGEKQWHLFSREDGAASHCQQAGGMCRAQALTMDWLEDTFSASSPVRKGAMRSNMTTEQLELLVEKYQGDEVAQRVASLNLYVE
jgi:pimeloyl-ACP methyl ester carboxylesterase